MAKKKADEHALYAAPRENLEQSKLKLARLKENFEYQIFFNDFFECDNKHRKAGDGVWPGLGFDRFGLVGLRFCMHNPFYKYDEIIDLVNPQKDISACSNNLVAAILPRLFYDPAVKLIEVGEIRHCEGGSQPIRTINERGLKPWERIYKVDLRKKKKQIMQEFEGYLDRAYFRNSEESNWTPDNSREREEESRHLAVWKLRRKRKSFSGIAKDQNITKDAAKKSFYRAFEMICGNKFDPVLFKRDYWEIRQADIGKQCKTCANHPDNGGDCNELCPDMLAYVDQDSAYQRKQAEDYQIDNLSKEDDDPEALLISAEEENS